MPKKEEEKIAEEYLARAYPGVGLTFEPDGNVPPDFRLDLQPPVAIEVRRLNQNVLRGVGQSSEAPEDRLLVGVEQDRLRLDGHLMKVCARVKMHGDRQFYLSPDMWDRKQLDFKLLSVEHLTMVYQGLSNDLTETSHGGVTLKWQRCSRPTIPSAIILLPLSDEYSAGWVCEEFQVNVQAVIGEKARKTVKNSSQPYEVWWLLLVNHLLTLSDNAERFEFTPDLKTFKRVIIINQAGHPLADYP